MAHATKRRVGESEVTVLGEKMEKVKSSTVSLTFSLALSIVGLALINVLVLLPSLNSFQLNFQQSIVGILFIVVCFLGISAALYPTKCRRTFEKTQNPLPQTNKACKSLQIKGHHPDCQNYSGNRIKVGRRVFCASCSGLIVGAVVALIGTVAYFFVGFNFVWSSVWFLAFGEIGVIFGLGQIRFAGYFKVFANAVFVVGSFVILAAVDAMRKSLLVDLYVLCLVLFLLWFRISLSEWNNRRTCGKCKLCFH